MIENIFAPVITLVIFGTSAGSTKAISICWRLLHQTPRQKDHAEFPFSSEVPLERILDLFDKGFDSLHLMEVLVCFVFFAFQYFPQQTLALEQIFSESKSDESWFLIFILYVTFDNWPYICWIKKWWITISHVEPFYPICGTKHKKSEYFQKSFTFTCPQTSMLYPLTTTQIYPSK